VLEGATRTIVHSRYARQLAGEWFGPGAAHGIDIIPHPRTAPGGNDRDWARSAARAALGITRDARHSRGLLPGLRLRLRRTQQADP
jgi:hypothetical protein